MVAVQANIVQVEIQTLLGIISAIKKISELKKACSTATIYSTEKQADAVMAAISSADIYQSRSSGIGG